jgi:hypothetical protein
MWSLSLPTITISEAIRFDLGREWVISHMDEEADTDVPTEHYSLFSGGRSRSLVGQNYIHILLFNYRTIGVGGRCPHPIFILYEIYFYRLLNVFNKSLIA